MRSKMLAVAVLFACAAAAVPARADESQDKNYAWKVPAGRYIDPASFFFLHGYVNGIYGSFSRDWTAADPAQIPGPGQLLAPNSNNSGFQYDAALIVGSELATDTRVMLETHYVSDPSGAGAAGPGGNTIAITEANGSWDLHPSLATLTGGLFWAPFGIVNQDWLGAQNLFTLIPRASGAFPTHFNERGVRLNGHRAFGDAFGANYVVSYGNGVQAWDLGGQTSTDRNENKTVVARVGLFPGLGKNLELGYSFASGRLRAGQNLAKLVGDPARSPATMTANGVDATYRRGGLLARSYWINSLERLGAISGEMKQDNLNRNGFMAEAAYAMTSQKPILKIKTFTPKFRYDWVDVRALNAGSAGSGHFKSAVYSFGLGLKPQNNVNINLEYHLQNELNRAELANNRFLARITFTF